MALHRRVRNRLPELLLAAIAEAGQRQARRWLVTSGALAGKRPRVGCPALLKPPGASVPASPPQTALRYGVGGAGLARGKERRVGVRAERVEYRRGTPTPDCHEAYRGICLRGAQNRRQTGRSMKPRSSRKTGDLPAGRAFPRCGPARCPRAGWPSRPAQFDEPNPPLAEAELLFARSCSDRGIRIRRLAEGPAKTPGFEMQGGSLVAGVEVKQIEPNEEVEKLLSKLRQRRSVAAYANLERPRQSIGE